jgi:type VI protein secretion system component VasA
VVAKGGGGEMAAVTREVEEEEVLVGRPVEKIRLEELATKYGLAVQAECIMQLRKDIFTLEGVLEKEKGKVRVTFFLTEVHKESEREGETKREKTGEREQEREKEREGERERVSERETERERRERRGGDGGEGI